VQGTPAVQGSEDYRITIVPARKQALPIHTDDDAHYVVSELAATLARLIIAEEQYDRRDRTAKLPSASDLRDVLFPVLKRQLYQQGDAVSSLIPDEFELTIRASSKFRVGNNPFEGQGILIALRPGTPADTPFTVKAKAIFYTTVTGTRLPNY
jgi:hypothetical protein